MFPENDSKTPHAKLCLIFSVSFGHKTRPGFQNPPDSDTLSCSYKVALQPIALFPHHTLSSTIDSLFWMLWNGLQDLRGVYTIAWRVISGEAEPLSVRGEESERHKGPIACLFVLNKPQKHHCTGWCCLWCLDLREAWHFEASVSLNSPKRSTWLPGKDTGSPAITMCI